MGFIPNVVSIGEKERTYLDAVYVRFDLETIDTKIEWLSRRIGVGELDTASGKPATQEENLEFLEIIYISEGY